MRCGGALIFFSLHLLLQPSSVFAQQQSNSSCFSCCDAALDAVNGTAAYKDLSQAERDGLLENCNQGCTKQDATDCSSAASALLAIWCGFGFNFGQGLTVELPDNQIYQCIDGTLSNDADVAGRESNPEQMFVVFVGGGFAALVVVVGGVLAGKYAAKKRRELQEGDPKSVDPNKPWLNSNSRAHWLTSRLASLDGKRGTEQEHDPEHVEEGEEGYRRPALSLGGLKPKEMSLNRFFSRHKKETTTSHDEEYSSDEHELTETIDQHGRRT